MQMKYLWKLALSNLP